MPLYEAVMLAEVEMRTIDVFTVKVALVAPDETVTLEGTLAAAGSLLESKTCAPPVGAGAVRVTVPLEDCTPPITLVGLSVNEERVAGTGGGAGAGADWKFQIAGFGSFSGTATKFFGEIT